MANVIYKKLNFNIAFQEYHPPLPLSFFGSETFLKTYKRITGTDVGFIYAVKNSELTGYMEAESSERISQSMQKRLTLPWLNKELSNFEKHVVNLKKNVENARKEKYNQQRLIKLFESISKEVGNIYPYSNAFYLLSSEIEKRILQTLQQNRSESSASQLLASVSAPFKATFLTSYFHDTESIANKLKKQYKSLKPAELKKLYNTDNKFKKQMDILQEKYFCLTSLNAGVRTVDSLLPDIANKLSKSEIKKEKTVVPKEVQDDVSMLRIMIYFKDEISTFIIPYVQYSLEKQWEAAAEILEVPIQDLQQLTAEELIDGLKKKKKIKNLVENRKHQTFFFHAPFKATIVYQGIAAEKELAAMKKQSSGIDLAKITEIPGKVGSAGRATGRVQKILNSAEISSFEDGRVLVAIYTAPEFVPAMKKAIAIVTDTGGITCHAAIVSRELGKPCVVGAKIATEVLQDGDMVEVDANKGIVKLVKRF